MPRSTQDYILKIFERQNQKNNPIKLNRDVITQIKNSSTVNATDRRAEPRPVSFSVNSVVSNGGIKASLRFDVVSEDIYRNDVRIIGYEIYRAEAEDLTEEITESISLIANIDASRVEGKSFSFEDASASASVYYYAIVAIDSNGRRSEPNFQKYTGDYKFINDMTLDSYSILSDKSININFGIDFTSSLAHQKEDEILDFIDLLDFIEVRSGSTWNAGDTILKTKQLSYNFRPNALSDNYFVKARNFSGNYSENELSLSIGSGQTIDWTIGTLDTANCSAEEEIYTNNDGVTISRIKLTLPYINRPANLLIKATRKGKLTIPDTSEYVVYDGEYDEIIYVEQGGSTGFQSGGTVAIGAIYDIKVYVKTSWGLVKTSFDFNDEVELLGSTIPPTPVFFVNSAGAEITSMTTPKYFELNWGESVDFDDDMYELRISKTNISDWGNADYLYRGRATKFVYTPTPDEFATYQTSGTIRFWIKSYNARGKEQDIANKIDITNNAPSKPNTPIISSNGSIFSVNISEKDTVDDKDIVEYELYRTINGIEDTVPITVKSGTTEINSENGINIKCRTKAVDIYGQKSQFSDFSNIKSLYLSYSGNTVTIYPTGDTSGVLDSINIYNANDYLKGYSGGKISLSNGDFYIKYSTEYPNLIDMSFECSISGSGGTRLNSIISSNKIIDCGTLSISNMNIVGDIHPNQRTIVCNSINGCYVENINIASAEALNIEFKDAVFVGGIISGSNFRNSDCSGNANSCNFYGNCYIYLETGYGIKYEAVDNTDRNIFIKNAINCDFFHSYTSTSLSSFNFGMVSGCNLYMNSQNINIGENTSRFSFVTKILNSYIQAKNIDVSKVVEITGTTIICNGYFSGNPIGRVFGAPPPCGVYSGLGDINLSSSTISCSSFDNKYLQQYDTCLDQYVVDSFTVNLSNSTINVSGSMIVNGTLSQAYSSVSYGSFSNPYNPAGRHYI